ncbi:MAG: hypothetical protein J0M37_15460 [Ignavibacteria bacterium]|nr:hypothetical protein [Ignavibacteria bacterium]
MPKANKSNFIIHGTLTDRNKNKLSGFLVIAFDRDMRLEFLKIENGLIIE